MSTSTPQNRRKQASLYRGAAKRRAGSPESAGIQADRAQEKRGRKPASESRATEIRTKLLAWKQTPEPQRISLRVLARELGTSHQLLGHYLTRWEKWQAEEYRRQANEIYARAKAENRSLSQWEEERVRAHVAAAFRWTLTGLLNDTLRQLNLKAKRGQLSAGEVKILNILARRGNREAQEILEKCSSAEKSRNNLPLIPSRAAKFFRSASR